ncbi:prostatic acid phosphatase-like [Bactrocera neohumeralis]|uniref:prostatic acid phosphatase-like n=1 Tax=Bactrocera neohumeralis TaxID=98809 RepID=UPI0021666366|nr:prostatic acid phosphatase-like [Bactrocera neohumeralis]
MFLQKITRKHVIILLSLCTVIAVILIYFYTTTGQRGEADRWINDANCPTVSVNTSKSTLKLVHMVFRHGARTPVTTYPNDPYVNDTFHPTGWGHVTNKGKVELYHLGEWLHRRYGKFMEPHYSPEYVYAQSTASPRALMSMSTVLASFFPPRGTDMEWNTEYNWQPIPVFSEPLEQDSLLLVRTPCPRFFEAREEVFQLPKVKAELAEHEDLFQNLTKLTGVPIKNADDVNSLYNTLLAEQEFGYTLPAWTKDYFPEKMQFLAEQSFIYNAYTKEMQKIKGGPFLKKMFAEMLEKRNGKLSPGNRKLFIYAAHDWTVGNIMASLNLWEGQMLRFAVTLIFELHQNQQTGEYYIEIYLRNSEDGCAELLSVPNCGAQCPLDRLIELNADVIPNETYEERCKAKNSNFVEPPKRAVERDPNSKL